jgi:hypothetical protein
VGRGDFWGSALFFTAFQSHYFSLFSLLDGLLQKNSSLKKSPKMSVGD